MPPFSTFYALSLYKRHEITKAFLTEAGHLYTLFLPYITLLNRLYGENHF